MAAHTIDTFHCGHDFVVAFSCSLNSSKYSDDKAESEFLFTEGGEERPKAMQMFGGARKKVTQSKSVGHHTGNNRSRRSYYNYPGEQTPFEVFNQGGVAGIRPAGSK